jgi:ribosomal protein L21E
MKKSKIEKYQVGDKVIWKTAPVEYKNDRSNERYYHGIGIITNKEKSGYVVTFHGNDIRQHFSDEELESVSKLHNVLF